MRYINFKKIVNGLFILLIISSPFFFLKIGNVNLTLFDLILVVLAPIASLLYFRENKSYFLFLTIGFGFLTWMLLPVFFTEALTNHITSFLQIILILLLLFPTVKTVFRDDLVFKSFRYLLIIWSIFLIWCVTLLTDIEAYYGGRFIGYYSNPLNKSLVLTSLILLYLEFYRKEKKVSVRLLYVAGLLLSIIFLVMTGNRASFLGLLIGLSIYYFFTTGLSRLVMTSILLVVIVTPFLLYLLQTFALERTLINRLFSLENIGVRLNDYLVSVPGDLKTLIVGTGINNSANFIQQQGGDFRPHNIFLCVLVENGVIGFILFFTLMIRIFFKSVYNICLLKLEKVNIKGLYVVLICVAIAIVVALQFNPLLFHRFFWLFLALVFCLSSKNITSFISTRQP